MKEYKIKARNILVIFTALILSPVIFFLIHKKKGNKNLKILVIPQLTRIGDLVCSTPVFRAIKLSYPESHLSVLVSNKVSGIIKNNMRINEIIIYENYSFFKLINKIRKENFDWSFSLSGTSLSTLITFLGFIKNRVKTTRENKPITEKLTDWLNNSKLLYKNHTYLPGHHLNLLKFIDIENPEVKKEIFISDEGNNKVKDFLKSENVSENNTLVGISISAGNKVKEWGDDKFLELSKKIMERYQRSKIIFIGSIKDNKRIENLMKGAEIHNFIKATHFSLEELPALIKKLNLFIAVDTGPIYIAHALGVPLIDIIGPVDPNEQPPLDEKSLRVMSKEFVEPSSFVFKKRGNEQKIKKSLEMTTVDSVLEAVDKLLKI